MKVKKVSERKVNRLPIIGVVLAVVCVAMYAGVAYGGASFWQMAAESYGEHLAANTITPTMEEIGELGAVTTTTGSLSTTMIPGIASQTEYGLLDFGSYDMTKDTEYTRLEVTNFTNATITPVSLINDYGKIVYIDDMWLQIVSKSTSTVRIGVTTSTVGYLSGDNTTYLDGDNGAMKLMKTLGNIFGNDGGIGNYVTSSNVFWQYFPGTDEALTAQKYPIVWRPDEYILVFATSTGDRNYGITGPNNTFDGKLYVKYRIIK